MEPLFQEVNSSLNIKRDDVMNIGLLLVEINTNKLYTLEDLRTKKNRVDLSLKI